MRTQRRSGIMLCYPFEEKRLHRWGLRALVQPKLDGVRCRAVWSEERDQWTLLSSEENEILSVPHIPRLMKQMQLPHHEYDGELYLHGLDFSEIFSRVSRSPENLHPAYHEVQFNVFDIVGPLPQILRLRKLSEQLGLTSTVRRVPTYFCSGIDQVLDTYQGFCDEAYEGMIVRKVDGLYVRRRSTEIMKFKPKKRDWYAVVGYKEEIDKNGRPKGTLGAIVAKGDDGTEFSIGSGLRRGQRVSLWNDRESLREKIVEVEYQHITPGRGVPRFPVFIRLIDPSEWKEDDEH